MDIAYDHLSSPIHTDTRSSTPNPSDPSSSTQSQTTSTLPTEFQQAFQAVSSSPWGTKLGGWFSSARQQGEALIQDAEREASKGWTSLAEQVNSRTRGMSLEGPVPGEEQLPIDSSAVQQNDSDKEKTRGEGEERPESLPADIVKEATSVFANLRVTAAARLRDLAKAEDKADEALEKFGLGVRDFLRNAVVISSPDDADGAREGEVLFETQEAGTGRKVFHTTRLDAQLHAIHTNQGSFTEEPRGGEWKGWRGEFDAEKQTEAIAKDLEKFPELRAMMEKLVPEKVEYKEFWERYYWLRKAVEEDEKRRKEVLKGATSAPEEEISWDDDDEGEDQSTTPQNPTPRTNDNATTSQKASQSTTTLNAPTSASNTLEAPRKSEDESRSVADSEASYDIVSGATSRATGSPKAKETKVVKVAGKEGESDEDDDWE